MRYYILVLIMTIVVAQNSTLINPCRQERWNDEFPCYLGPKENVTGCDYDLNPRDCQRSNSSCYFDFVLNECRETDNVVLQSIACTQTYLTQTACTNVTNPRKECVWVEDECMDYPFTYLGTCKNFPEMNMQTCKGLWTIISNYFYEFTYCEWDSGSNSCESNTTQIPDCGSNLAINIHRCVGYSTGNCYFEDKQCKPLTLDYSGAYTLNNIECRQANLALCSRVTTPNQQCQRVEIYETRKCANANQSSMQCSQLSELDFTLYSASVCSQATDACYFNGQGCQAPQQFYSCNQVGLSKTACTSSTQGRCVFSDNHCHDATPQELLTIPCSDRNSQSCPFGKCFFNNEKSICEDGPALCTNGLLLSCSQVSDNCYQSINGCAADLQSLSCWMIQSLQSCVEQKQLCYWINGKCRDPFACNSYTKEDCLLTNDPCVFDQGICRQVTNASKCDQYENVSYTFCAQFSNCVFQDFRCYDMTYIFPSQQEIKIVKRPEPSNKLKNPFQVETRPIEDAACNLLTDLVACTFNRTDKCEFIEGKCKATALSNACYTNLNKNKSVSVLNCEHITQEPCYFQSTLSGYGFCTSSQELQCSDLSDEEAFCVADYAQKIACAWVNDDCVPVNYSSCAQATNIKMSYTACQAIKDDSCGYDSISHLCKPITQFLDCQSATSLTQCLFMTNQSCLATLQKASFITCAPNPQNILSQNTSGLNNVYGCIIQTQSAVYFNIVNYQCQQFTSIAYQNVYECRYFNQIACLSQGILNCVWDTICKDYANQDQLQCSSYPQSLCLNVNTSCQWAQNKCIAYTPAQNCTANKSSISKGSCSLATDVPCIYNGLSCIQGFAIACEYFGANRLACISGTIACYWNGNRCMNPNKQLKCSDDVSQQACEQIHNQSCLWNNGCIQQKSTDCSAYTKTSSPAGCIAQAGCAYNYGTQVCSAIKFTPIECQSGYSLELCTQAIDDICVWNNGCTQWHKEFSSCKFIINRNGCQQVNMKCKWEDNQCQDVTLRSASVPCQNIPININRYGCETINSKALIKCQFDPELNQCQFDLTEEEVSNLSSNDILKVDLCPQATTRSVCVHLLLDGQFCQWKNKQCQQSTLESCLNQNKWACLANTQTRCAWRNNTCIVAPEIKSLEEATMVSALVCLSAENNLNVRYDATQYGCVQSTPETDLCSSPGLNKRGCLMVQQHLCEFDTTCKTYVPKNEVECTDYENISALVCAKIATQKCKFDSENFTCIRNQPSQDRCSTPGLSMYACLDVQLDACIWNDVCKDFQYDEKVNQCDLTSLVSAKSCGVIAYQYLPCVYDPENYFCSPTFNRYYPCDTPGLNEQACYETLQEPCMFIEGTCRLYENKADTQCFQVRAVNEYACRTVTDDECGWDVYTHNCYSLIYDPYCTLPGLNYLGCKQVGYCQWDSNQSICYYEQRPETQYTNCQDQSIDKCSGYCVVYKEQCVYQQCRYMDKCFGTTLFNMLPTMPDIKCYQNNQQRCLGATRCEDIVGLNAQYECSQYIFSGTPCKTYLTGNQRFNCYSANNFAILCQQDGASSADCKQIGNYYRPLQCSDIQMNRCNNSPNCVYMNRACISISQCSDIKQEEICNDNIRVNGEECAYLEYKIMVEGEFQCTSTWCRLYGSSDTLCTGNEINGRSCILDPYYKCQICEHITDQGLCENSKGACEFRNYRCTSILCGDNKTKQTCNSFKDRCYWSDQENGCNKICIKNIRKSECDKYPNECNWNDNSNTCNQGTEQLPDLNVIVELDEDEYLYGILLSVMIIMGLF